MHRINIENLSVAYAAADQPDGKRIIINDVNLKVQDGEFVAVVGPSGCGKSTVLQMILGQKTPNTGVVMVEGSQVSQVTRDCGIVYQQYSIFPHLNVRDNVALGVVLEKTGIPERLLFQPLINLAKLFYGKRLPPLATTQPNTPFQRLLGKIRYYRVLREGYVLAEQLLSHCGLDPKVDGDKYPFELSGGMRQRVAIAQALIMRPKILLMDEPFGALDEKTRRAMQDFIHDQWKDHGLTVFFVTHDLREACVLGTRLIVLSQYWRNQNSPGRGAKILMDIKIAGGNERPSTFAASDGFKGLVSDINDRTLNKNNLLSINDFILTHPDAIHLTQKGS